MAPDALQTVDRPEDLTYPQVVHAPAELAKVRLPPMPCWSRLRICVWVLLGRLDFNSMFEGLWQMGADRELFLGRALTAEKDVVCWRQRSFDFANEMRYVYRRYNVLQDYAMRLTNEPREKRKIAKLIPSPIRLEIMRDLDSDMRLQRKEIDEGRQVFDSPEWDERFSIEERLKQATAEVTSCR